MNKKLIAQLIPFFTILLLILTIFSPSVQSVPPVTQETIIVDITGNGDYTSITEAIRNANANVIIKIKEGIYKENNLEVNKKLTIIGDDQTNTIIDFEGNNGFSLISPYININNLKMINSNTYAVSVEFDSIWCNISHCDIEIPMHKTGIQVKASSTVISDCNINGTDSTGIGVEIRKTSNIIKNCNIHGLAIGVLGFIDAYNNEVISCNLFDNIKAVEIRINSQENIVSTCNIYANEIGVYFWQEANYNSVYLNNFWRNDLAASDQCNNTWDNGLSGNYWDQYTGYDSNNDGLGDTPFIISEGNEDRYPLIDMILPGEITLPSNVKQISRSSDNRPSFTWIESIYNEGIAGYYVKIDNNPEAFIGDTTSWTSSDNVSDGVHTFYVKAKGNDNIFSSYASLTFTIDTTFIDSDNDGWSDEEEQIYGTDPNNPENYPLDTDNDGIPDTVDTDDDNDGYSDEMENSYGTSTTDSDSYPLDTDNDGIPDKDSLDGKFKGDIDDDDDSLIDTIEIQLGSNPLDDSDVLRIYINGNPYYLVDTTQNQIFNILYEQTNDKTTSVEKQGDKYLLDIDGDGSWDNIYVISQGTISTYEEQSNATLIILIAAGIAVLIIASYAVITYNKRKTKKQKIRVKTKILKKKLPYVSKKPYVDDKETIQMISQTRLLLQNIQHDVSTYMEKLNTIEDQITMTSIPSEEKTKEIIKKPEIPESYDDIDAKVDYFLSEYEKKNKK